MQCCGRSESVFTMPVDRSPPLTRNAAARKLPVLKHVKSLTDLSAPGGSSVADPIATHGDSGGCHSCSVLLNELLEIKEMVRNLSADCMAMKNQLTAIHNSRPIPTVSEDKVTSFADVLKKSNPVVVVKPKDRSQNCSATMDEIKKTIDPSKVPVCSARNAANGSIILECPSVETTAAVINDVASKLGDNYSVTAPRKRRPKVNVIGIEEDVANEELLDLIKSQNSELFNDESILEIRNRFDIKKYGTIGIKLEVDALSFQNIMDKGKLSIGWRKCSVYESFDLLRCFKCSEYHHVSKNCNGSLCCSKCSGPHLLSECTSITEKCVNCVKITKDLKMNIDINHAASSTTCHVYKRKIEFEKRRIEYSTNA